MYLSTLKCKITLKNIEYKYNYFNNICILVETGIKPFLKLVDTGTTATVILIVSGIGTYLLKPIWLKYFQYFFAVYFPCLCIVTRNSKQSNNNVFCVLSGAQHCRYYIV